MNLPIELINKILIMRPTHPTAKIINHMYTDVNEHMDQWFCVPPQTTRIRTPDFFVDFYRFYFHYHKYNVCFNTNKFYKLKIEN